MSEVATRVHTLAAPLAERAGVELLDVAVKGSGSRQVVRVVVDRKGGVTLEACRVLSDALSAALDAEDPIAGRYTLEVSSPGVDWPLRDQRAFDRVEGRDVLVHRDADDGRVTQVEGRVLAAEPDAVVLDVDGERVAISYSEIVKASQRLPW